MKLGVLLAMASSAVFSGCIAGGQFPTAHTIEPKKTNVTVGLNFYGRDGGRDLEGSPIPMPSVGVRVGVADRWDVGAQVIAFGQLRFDVKHQLVDGDAVDVAAIGAAWLSHYPAEVDGVDRSMLIGSDLILVAGLSPSADVTFVPWLGPGYALEPATPRGAFVLRGGAGLRWQLSESVAFIPIDVTMVMDPARGSFVDGSLGLGFAFGAQN